MTDLVELVLNIVADCLDRRPKMQFAEVNFAGKGGLHAKMPRRFKPKEIFDDLGPRPGRPVTYDWEAIAAIAEEVAREANDESIREYLDWVRDRLDQRRQAVPGATALKQFCTPIYRRIRRAGEE
jgi:hypothetical protein